MVDSGVQGFEAMEAYETEIQQPQQQQHQQQQQEKTCAECGKTMTPLWWTSPDRTKTLYNACGIKSRTKGNNNGKKKRKMKNKEISFQQRIRNLVSEVMPHRSQVERRWRKLC